MTALKSYLNGIKEAILQPKMIFTLWLINFLFASVVYFPLSGLIKDFIGKSVAAERLLTEWDNHVFFEWIIHKFSALQPVLLLILIITVLYAVLSLFLKGGILSVFAVRAGESRKISERWCPRFFHGAAKFWWRFFRLFIYSLIFWAIFLAFMYLLSGAGRFISNGGLREQTAFVWFWIQAGIGIFLIFLIMMILDYARIRIVLEDTGKVFLSLWNAAGFVFSRLGRTLALYYLLTLTGVLLFLIYWKSAGMIKTYAAEGIWLAFIAGQVFIAARQWLLMSFQAGQLDLYLQSRKEKKTPPQPPETKDFEEEDESGFEKPLDDTWDVPLEDNPKDNSE